MGQPALAVAPPARLEVAGGGVVAEAAGVFLRGMAATKKPFAARRSHTCGDGRAQTERAQRNKGKQHSVLLRASGCSDS